IRPVDIVDYRVLVSTSNGRSHAPAATTGLGDCDARDESRNRSGREPMVVPGALATQLAGSGISQTSRTVGASGDVISTTSSPRTVTTAGPSTPGSQARPSRSGGGRPDPVAGTDGLDSS